MSAPDTDVEKQSKRHRPALIGIVAAAVFGVLMMIVLTLFVFARGDEPEGADVQIDGRTGIAEEVEE